MTTLRDEVASISEVLATTSISKKKRAELETFLRSISSYKTAGLVTRADRIANPDVREDDPYYWQWKDRETARHLQDGSVKVNAVNIDSEFDERSSTPNGWYPRVELTVNMTTIVDLDAEDARRLAFQLLTAAEVVSR